MTQRNTPITDTERAELQERAAHIKIGFFDIDGTLLSFKTHEIPSSTLNALVQLHDRGVLLYIASGRAPFQLPKIILHGEGDFKGFDGFLCNSGQICMDMRGVFRKVPLDPDDVAIAKANAQKHGFDLSAMTDSSLHVNHMGPRVKKLQEDAKVTYDGGDLEVIGDRPIFQMNAFVDPQDEPLILEGTKHTQAVRWCDEFTDLIPVEGGKDVGIKAVLDHYGFTQQESVAFGDGGNDATMLAFTGLGLAMGNADYRAKDVANIITADIEDNGVYKACVALGLIKDELNLCADVTITKTERAGHNVYLIQ